MAARGKPFVEPISLAEPSPLDVKQSRDLEQVDVVAATRGLKAEGAGLLCAAATRLVTHQFLLTRLLIDHPVVPCM